MYRQHEIHHKILTITQKHSSDKNSSYKNKSVHQVICDESRQGSERRTADKVCPSVFSFIYIYIFLVFLVDKTAYSARVQAV